MTNFDNDDYLSTFAVAGDSLAYRAMNGYDAKYEADVPQLSARIYDSLLGLTPTMDPLSEKYYSISPYAWCGGNPVFFNGSIR